MGDQLAGLQSKLLREMHSHHPETGGVHRSEGRGVKWGLSARWAPLSSHIQLLRARGGVDGWVQSQQGFCSESEGIRKRVVLQMGFTTCKRWARAS